MSQAAPVLPPDNEPDLSPPRHASRPAVSPEEMQVPLITRPGAKPKSRLGYYSALVVVWVLGLLPSRGRVAFAIALNFFYNHVFATLRMGASFASRALTRVLIFLTYFLVLGPVSIFARLTGADYLLMREKEGSLFLPKEPADETEERFLRQF